MAVEKMVLLNLVGSLEDEHAMLEQLVLCESVHIDIDQRNLQDNNYIVHQYESMMSEETFIPQVDLAKMVNTCDAMEQSLMEICKGLGKIPKIDKLNYKKFYQLEDAQKDLGKFKEEVGDSIIQLNEKRDEITQLEVFKDKVKWVKYKELPINDLKNLNFFECKLGLLSKESNAQIKKNYENIGALVLKIGDIEDVKESIYLVMYPKSFEEETSRLLKSLNWETLHIPKGLAGNMQEILVGADEKIKELNAEIKVLEQVIIKNKEEKDLLLNKIYTKLKLERKIIEIQDKIAYGNNLFVLNMWVPQKEQQKVEEAIGNVTDKFVVMATNAEELDQAVIPPTKLKNHQIFKPFETIVGLYGLPTYHEIDPTPFLAITFCLMFGIMFGDLGQGLIYFLAGVLLYKKTKVGSGILMRLGGSSMIFGIIYGSFFGLEELPWLPGIVGSPLAVHNIPRILVVGITFGVIVLSVSFVFGIINALHKKDLENGLFGKNGVAGYIFFMGLVFTGIALVGVIPVSPFVPVAVMIAMLVIMVFKEPLANRIKGHTPYIHGEKSEYFVESGFECVETFLSALSNGISFIRVGAFALNHAGLFLAFLVIAEMMPNIVLKFIILLIGNVLILSLEGLVVFIQGLRLQYYEMFSKYFAGDGMAYRPIKIEG